MEESSTWEVMSSMYGHTHSLSVIALSSGAAEYYGMVKREHHFDRDTIAVEGHGDGRHHTHVHGFERRQMYRN